jgi:hypothetical protein
MLYSVAPMQRAIIYTDVSPTCFQKQAVPVQNYFFLPLQSSKNVTSTATYKFPTMGNSWPSYRKTYLLSILAACIVKDCIKGLSNFSKILGCRKWMKHALSAMSFMLRFGSHRLPLCTGHSSAGSPFLCAQCCLCH